VTEGFVCGVGLLLRNSSGPFLFFDFLLLIISLGVVVFLPSVLMELTVVLMVFFALCL
jgi:hypothetical protein